MKKYILALFSIGLLTFAFSILVKPSFGKSTQRLFRLPVNAKAISPNLYHLGYAKDVNGREVEGYAYIHRKESEIKPEKPGKGRQSCYGYIANGAKWREVEGWVVNPANTKGLNEGFIYSNLVSDIDKWNSAAGQTVVGSGTGTTDTLFADTGSPDNKNEVYFADIEDSSAIGVTIVWGYFSGPPQTRELVEWDQVYDDSDYDWSLSGEANKMDFENIATHEIGHTFGMGDVYSPDCAEVTEYGYADYGETNKRSLEQPDIDGVKALYK